MNYDPNKVYDLPLGEIFADEAFNCRGIIDPLTVIDLSKSIAEKGLEQPIVVQPWEDKPGKKYRILMGYRRYKACQMAKLPAIRCLVKEGVSAIEARVLNLTENLQREDLSIKQEALAIDHLRMAGWGIGEVSRKLNMSYGWVQTRFKLLELPEEIQDEIAAGMIPVSKVMIIGALGSRDLQFQYIRELKDKKLLGKKRDIKPPTGLKNVRQERNRIQILELQDIIRETFDKNTFATRVLAWAAGEISDLEMHRSLKEEATKAGRYYIIPEGLEGIRANREGLPPKEQS